MTAAQHAKPSAPPQATWFRDGERWAILVPRDLARPGERVLVARSDGSRLRTVTIRTVTARGLRGMILCHID